MERSREIELIRIGLSSEMNKIQENIRRGEKILSNRKRGIKDKSPLSSEEIRARINNLRSRSQILDKEKFDFEYEIVS